jgi:energy-coupling factor transport system permease protein
MSIKADLYISGESWLHRTDPRVKMLLVTTSLFLLILFKNLWVMLAALGLLHWIHWSARTPVSRLLFVWKTLLPVAILMFALRTIFYPAGEPILAIWLLKITPEAMAQGAVLALRIVTMAFSVFAWLYTTAQPDLVQAFVSLGMPHEWGMVLALALRYIPTFQGTYLLVFQAQQARGLDVSRHTGISRARVMMPIFVAMIISSLRASSQIAMSMEARGYGQTGVKRSTLNELRFRAWDYGLAAFILLGTLILTYLNLRFGFGAQPIAL